MSVPTTLQGTHDGCGGTVVFRPATHRRELLAGQTVVLSAACLTCGSTLSTEWALPGAESVAWQHVQEHARERAQEFEQALPMAAGAEEWSGHAPTAVQHRAPARPTFRVDRGSSQASAGNERRTAARPGAALGEWSPRGGDVAPATATPRLGLVAREPVVEPTPDPVVESYMSEFASRVEVARENLRRVSAGLPSLLEGGAVDRGFRSPRLSRREAIPRSTALGTTDQPAVDREPVVGASEPIPLSPESIVSAPEPIAPEPIAPEPIAPDPVATVEPVVPEPVATAEPVAPMIAPTDDDVFPPPPVPEQLAEPTAFVATSDAAADVWGELPVVVPAPATVGHLLDNARLEHPAEHPVDASVAYDAEDRGFYWGDDDVAAGKDRPHRSRWKKRPKQDARLDQDQESAPVKAGKPAKRGARSRKRPRNELSIENVSAPDIAAAAPAPAPDASAAAGRVRIGLIGVAVVALLAVTSGIAGLKIMQARGAEPVATPAMSVLAPEIAPAVAAKPPTDPPGAAVSDATSNKAPDAGAKDADVNGFADAAESANAMKTDAVAASSVAPPAQDLDDAADTPVVTA